MKVLQKFKTKLNGGGNKPAAKKADPQSEKEAEAKKQEGELIDATTSFYDIFLSSRRSHHTFFGNFDNCLRIFSFFNMSNLVITGTFIFHLLIFSCAL